MHSVFIGALSRLAAVSIAGILTIDAALCDPAPQLPVGSEYDEAINEYTEAIKRNPEDADAYLIRGMAYLLRGDDDEAIQDITYFLMLGGKHATALAARGQAFYRKGDLHNAIRDFDEAIMLDPEHITGTLARGEAYRAKGDLDRALNDYYRVVELDPAREAQYRNVICWTIVTLGGDLKRALNECDRSLKIEPARPATFDSRGLVHLKLGRLGKARTDFEDALKQKALPSSMFCLGIIKRKTGDIRGGDADIAAAKAIDPKIAETFAKYGVMP